MAALRLQHFSGLLWTAAPRALLCSKVKVECAVGGQKTQGLVCGGSRKRNLSRMPLQTLVPPPPVLHVVRTGMARLTPFFPTVWRKFIHVRDPQETRSRRSSIVPSGLLATNLAAAIGSCNRISAISARSMVFPAAGTSWLMRSSFGRILCTVGN